MPTSSDLPAPTGAFKWQTDIQVDPLYAEVQHVGNIELGRVFHWARVEFNRYLAGQMRGAHHFSDQVIVRIETDFIAETFWSPSLTIDLRVSGIGRTSYDLELVILERGTIAARCITVNVWMKDGKPEPLSDEARQVLISFS